MRMTRRREDRREKREFGARARGSPQVRERGRGTRYEVLDAHRTGPASAPQVDAGPQSSGKAHVPRYDQHQPAGAADACEVAAQTRATGLVVVPEHHAGEASRQSADGGPWVRQL